MATRTQHEDVDRPSRAASTCIRYFILAIIVIATAINYLDRANLSIAEPPVKKDLHISDVEMGLIFSAFSWTYAALQIPGGWILERVGPRKTFGVAPPGYPVLVPGQVFSQEILSFMRSLDTPEVHGYRPDLGYRVYIDKAVEIASAATAMEIAVADEPPAGP